MIVFYSVMTVVWFFLGFLCGILANKSEVEKVQNEIKERIKRDQTIPPGIIKRPDARTITYRNLDPKEKAAMQAVKETLDGVPELQKL